MQWVRSDASRRRFEVFVASATDTLLRAGLLMTGDLRDAEDLVQEALLQVARRWRRVESMDHPIAYARQIVVNLALDGAQRRTRRRAELVPDGGSHPQSADADAARAFRAVDDLAELCWALSKLPPRVRAVLVLRYWADMPAAEVASTLGCSVGTVKSTASRGAAQLAFILTQEGATRRDIQRA